MVVMPSDPTTGVVAGAAVMVETLADDEPTRPIRSLACFFNGVATAFFTVEVLTVIVAVVFAMTFAVVFKVVTADFTSASDLAPVGFFASRAFSIEEMTEAVLVILAGVL